MAKKIRDMPVARAGRRPTPFVTVVDDNFIDQWIKNFNVKKAALDTRQDALLRRLGVDVATAQAGSLIGKASHLGARGDLQRPQEIGP